MKPKRTVNALRIPFKKMNGLGNDFVIIDAREQAIAIAVRLSQAIADRASGIGCDQVIMLEPSSRADLFMRIINADGSEVDACGNATRCVASLTRALHPIVETRAGVLRAEVLDNGTVRVDMGAPKLNWDQIPLASLQPDTRAISLSHELPDGRMLQDPSVVNVGNPHCIFWVMDVESYDLASFGRELEGHAMFPERANISLAEVLPAMEGIGKNRIKLRVWERGAGITRACGTAACAVAVAAHRAGKTGRMVDVELPGGIIAIEWRAEDDHIMMTGPVAYDFDGHIHLTESGNWHSFTRDTT